MADRKTTRFSVSVTAEEHTLLEGAATRAGLTLSRYLVACAEQVGGRRVGLRPKIPAAAGIVDREIRHPHSNHTVVALVIYRRAPVRIEHLSDKRTRRCHFTPRQPWLWRARVGDVVVWETATSHRVGVVSYEEVQFSGWHVSRAETAAKVNELLARNGRMRADSRDDGEVDEEDE